MEAATMDGHINHIYMQFRRCSKVYKVTKGNDNSLDTADYSYSSSSAAAAMCILIYNKLALFIGKHRVNKIIYVHVELLM